MSYSKLPKTKNKNQSQPIKKQRPKPEWTTDFIDRSQYKLSTSQMVQKKEALQSKNKDLARQQLQQRRRKLQLGIIDEQTRKIYETALISKNIDINPPLRRNLTQMIRYEKQQKQKMAQYDEDNEGQQNQQQCDPQEQSQRDIKQAQDFIRKFQKAKKQQKIQRAVEILTNNHSNKFQNKNGGIRSPQKQPRPKVDNFLDYMNDQKSYNNKTKNMNQSQSFSQDEAISSIQDTIKFMQQKLFAAKKTVEQHSKSFINQTDQDQSFSKEAKTNNLNKNTNSGFLLQNQNNKKPQKFKKALKKCDQINFATHQNFYNQEVDDFDSRIGQISQLRIKIKNQNSSDDECLDTIRRMRQIMESKQFEFDGGNRERKKLKQNIRDNFTPNSLACNSTIYKNSHNCLQSQAEVSFNLTVNNDDQYDKQSSILRDTKKHKQNNFMITDNYKLGKQTSKLVNKSNFNGHPKDLKVTNDEYEDQYQRIKQNLFNCINSPQQTNNQKNNNIKLQNIRQTKPVNIKKIQDDSEQQSEDSLMIKDRINMWKKQLQPQIQPQDQDEEQIHQNKNYINKKHPKQTKTKYSYDQQDDDAYKYNFINQKTYKISGQQKKEETSYEDNPFKMGQKSKNINAETNLNMMKKPPIVKKNKQGQNQLEAMKQMISKASSQIQRIQIQPLKIQPLHSQGQVLGFDFRGSINIKKNILSK